MKSIHVHIDRLTLEGKTPAEARTIVASMERRLTELANGARTSPAGGDAIGCQTATRIFRKVERSGNA